jgi:hypothetical protein
VKPGSLTLRRAASDPVVARCDQWRSATNEVEGTNVSSLERNFPVLHVADEPGTDDPAEVRKRMLKQLADRLDQHHAFAKGQFVA